MGQPYQTTRRVEFHQTDAAGIMHFAQFYLWMEQAEHEMLRSVGLSVMGSSEDGSVSWPRVAASCQFFRPVRFEDVVQLEVALQQMTNRSATYQIVFRLNQQEVARGEVTAVCCQVRDGQLTAVPIPATYRQRLQNFQRT
jgi:4-hydroxybenzoyl-CoA thioesterase/acyl-CoA thioester hydrolase